MNKSYRNIFNRRTGTWVAAPETARSGGKKTGTVQAIKAITAIATSLALGVFAAAPALAADFVEGDSTLDAGGFNRTYSASGAQSVAFAALGRVAVSGLSSVDDLHGNGLSTDTLRLTGVTLGEAGADNGAAPGAFAFPALISLGGNNGSGNNGNLVMTVDSASAIYGELAGPIAVGLYAKSHAAGARTEFNLNGHLELSSTAAASRSYFTGILAESTGTGSTVAVNLGASASIKLTGETDISSGGTMSGTNGGAVLSTGGKSIFTGLAGSHVDTIGDAINGLTVYGAGGVTVTSATNIITQGHRSKGLRAVAHETVIVNNSGTIETTGTAAQGIDVAAGGTSVAAGSLSADVSNSDNITTNGADSGGISIGNGASASYGDFKLVNTGNITTHGGRVDTAALWGFGALPYTILATKFAGSTGDISIRAGPTK